MRLNLRMADLRDVLRASNIRERSVEFSFEFSLDKAMPRSLPPRRCGLTAGMDYHAFDIACVICGQSMSWHEAVVHLFAGRWHALHFGLTVQPCPRFLEDGGSLLVRLEHGDTAKRSRLGTDLV